MHYLKQIWAKCHYHQPNNVLPSGLYHRLCPQSNITWEPHFRSLFSSVFTEENKQCGVFHPFCICWLLYSTLSVLVLFATLRHCDWSIRLKFAFCCKYSSTLRQLLFHIVLTIVQKKDPCICSEPLMGGCSDKSRVGGFLRVIQWRTLPLCYSITHQLSNNTRIIE